MSGPKRKAPAAEAPAEAEPTPAPTMADRALALAASAVTERSATVDLADGPDITPEQVAAEKGEIATANAARVDREAPALAAKFIAEEIDREGFCGRARREALLVKARAEIARSLDTTGPLRLARDEQLRRRKIQADRARRVLESVLLQSGGDHDKMILVAADAIGRARGGLAGE